MGGRTAQNMHKQACATQACCSHISAAHLAPCSLVDRVVDRHHCIHLLLVRRISLALHRIVKLLLRRVLPKRLGAFATWYAGGRAIRRQPVLLIRCWPLVWRRHVVGRVHVVHRTPRGCVATRGREATAAGGRLFAAGGRGLNEGRHGGAGGGGAIWPKRVRHRAARRGRFLDFVRARHEVICVDVVVVVCLPSAGVVQWFRLRKSRDKNSKSDTLHCASSRDSVQAGARGHCHFDLRTHVLPHIMPFRNPLS